MASTINAKSTGSGSLESTADASGILALQTGGVTAMTIDTSQNVGIGTTTIQGKFNVGGGRSNFGANSETYSIAVGYTQARCNSGQTYYIGATDSATPDLVFSNAAGTERMRIDSSGNVGIGLTPTSKLSMQCSSQTFGGGFNIKVSGGTSNFEFVNGGDNKLYLGYASSGTPSAVGNFATNGTYTATSDIRKKKDISYTFNGLEIINALKPAQGRMLEDDDTSPLRPMFIAQDMVDVIPSLVSNLEPEPSDDPLLGVDYASITPILVKAIQEQQTIINDLKARIETLEAK